MRVRGPAERKAREGHVSCGLNAEKEDEEEKRTEKAVEGTIRNSRF